MLKKKEKGIAHPSAHGLVYTSGYALGSDTSFWEKKKGRRGERGIALCRECEQVVSPKPSQCFFCVHFYTLYLMLCPCRCFWVCINVCVNFFSECPSLSECSPKYQMHKGAGISQHLRCLLGLARSDYLEELKDVNQREEKLSTGMVLVWYVRLCHGWMDGWMGGWQT